MKAINSSSHLFTIDGTMDDYPSKKRYDFNNNNEFAIKMDQEKPSKKPKRTFKDIVMFWRKKGAGETSIADMDLAKEVNIKDHLHTPEELERKYQTNVENGLSSSEAAMRLKRDGPNAFSPPKVTPPWVMLLKEWTAGFSLLFWLAVATSVLCYFLEWNPQDVSIL